MKLRKGYDSTTAAAMPADGDVYFPYIDGAYDNFAAVTREHPGKVIVPITCLGSTDRRAVMGDVEPGCMWPPAHGAQWGHGKVTRDGHATLYTFAAELGTLRALVEDGGTTAAAKVNYAIARYSLDRSIPPGVVAVQWSSPDGPVGTRPPGHYDQWVIAPWVEGWDPPHRKPKFHRLRHGPRRTARQLEREVRRLRRGVTDPRDRRLLRHLLAQIRRLLGRTKP